MKALIKWLLIAVLIIVLVPLILGVVASMIIDPNDFKPQIIEQVENNTRGSLSIDGELGWSVFPSVGVEMNKVTFSLPEDRDGPFAALEGVKLGVKLLPLFKMAVEADGVTVDGLKMNLLTDSNGVANWERIFPETDEVAEVDEGGVQAAPLSIDIAKVEIIDSSVRMANDQDGSVYQLNDFNFTSTDISVDGDKFPVDMSFNVALSDPDLTSESRIQTNLAADMANQVFKFDDLNADFLLAGEMFSSKKVNLNLKSSGTYNGAASSASLANLALDLAGELKADMKLDITGLDGKSKYAGDIDVASFDLNDLLAALGMETMEFNNSDAMSNVSFKGTLSGPANSFIISPVQLGLDSTNFTGKMGIKNMDTSEYVFVLRGDKINIDDYSSPAEEEAAAGSDDVNAALLPLAALRDLLFNAEFGFNEMIAGGMNITELDIRASGNKGLVKLDNMSAKLYDGSMTMNASVDGRNDNPPVKVNAKLNGVDMLRLMTDFAEVDTVTGTARMDMALTTSGNSTAAFQSNLDGPITFGVDNAVLTNLNADKLACQAISQIRQKPIAADKQWAATTVFKSIGGTLQFNNGVGTNNDLNATLENMLVKGKGVVDLNASTVDYQVALNVTGDLAEPGEDGAKSACAINQKYREVDLPIRCKGALDADPGDLCGIDVAGLGKVAGQVLKAEAKEKIDEKKDELKNKLSEKLFGKKEAAAEGAAEGGEAAAEGADAAPAEKESLEDQLKKKAFEGIFGK